ncbi:chemotaxis protein, partial [Rhizobium leguminosarum]
PIFDLNGKVFKVLKFSTDVTARVENVEQLALCLTNFADCDLSQTIQKPFIPSLERLRIGHSLVEHSLVDADGNGAAQCRL